MNQLNAILLNYLKFTGDKNIFSQESMECMLTGYKAMRQKSKYCMLPTEKCSESLGILSMVLFLVQDLHPKMKTWRIHEVYTAREFSSPQFIFYAFARKCLTVYGFPLSIVVRTFVTSSIRVVRQLTLEKIDLLQQENKLRVWHLGFVFISPCEYIT